MSGACLTRGLSSPCTGPGPMCRGQGMSEENGRLTPRGPVVDASLCTTIGSQPHILILARYFSAPWYRGGHILPTIRLRGVMHSCQQNVSGDHTHLSRALPGWLGLISVLLPQEPRSSERSYSFSPRPGIRTHAAQRLCQTSV